jgi:hypothetical protein
MNSRLALKFGYLCRYSNTPISGFVKSDNTRRRRRLCCVCERQIPHPEPATHDLNWLWERIKAEVPAKLGGDTWDGFDTEFIGKLVKDQGPT